MNFSASLVERTIVAVDYFINRAISGAWESVCRSALGYKRQQPPPEEDYGGGPNIRAALTAGGTDEPRLVRQSHVVRPALRATEWLHRKSAQ
jgi:hypothetical protein